MSKLSCKIKPVARPVEPDKQLVSRLKLRWTAIHAGLMERFDEGSRGTGKFSWSRSAFANAASKVSTQSINSSAVSRSPQDDKVAATLVVDPDPQLGAGLEVEFVEGRGYRVEWRGRSAMGSRSVTTSQRRKREKTMSIRSSPGQPSLRVGDLLVEVNGKCLALENEARVVTDAAWWCGLQDDADEVLANELRHGVPLLLQREPTTEADPSGEPPTEPTDAVPTSEP
eukprot:Skav216406  [mRNA]  locus=scaffold457:391975:398712:+ [translate_table: standard]